MLKNICTLSASFPALIIFLRYSIEYFDFVFSWFSVCIFVSSPFLISMFALLRFPSAAMANVSGSAENVTLSAMMSASAIAFVRMLLVVLIFTGNVKFGILCSFSSNSISGMLKVLVFLPFSLMCSLLSSVMSKVRISFAFTLLRICLKFARFIAISLSFSMSYSVKLLDNNLKITIATFAGSIAIISSPSRVILKLASFTRSEITLMLSLRMVGSANTSFIIFSPFLTVDFRLAGV